MTRDAMSSLPTWARFIGIVGVPSAIALFLVYHLSGFATSGLASMNDTLAAHAMASQVHVIESKDTANAQLKLLWRICVNTARDTQAQERCSE